MRGLRVAGARDAPGQLSPVVEDPRHVLDAVGLLGDAEHELEVLDAVEGRVEPADALDERAAQHQQMADVHHAAEELGRPVGLEEGLAVRAATVDLVLVGVDRVGVGLLVQQPDAFEERVRVELVVVVEEGDELALGRLERAVARGRDAAVGVAEADLDPGLACERAQVLERALVRRAVVGEAELPVGIGLAPDGLDGPPEEFGVDVVDRSDDRDERAEDERRSCAMPGRWRPWRPTARPSRAEGADAGSDARRDGPDATCASCAGAAPSHATRSNGRRSRGRGRARAVASRADRARHGGRRAPRASCPPPLAAAAARARPRPAPRSRPRPRARPRRGRVARGPGRRSCSRAPRRSARRAGRCSRPRGSPGSRRPRRGRRRGLRDRTRAGTRSPDTCARARPRGARRRNRPRGRSCREAGGPLARRASAAMSRRRGRPPRSCARRRCGAGRPSRPRTAAPPRRTSAGGGARRRRRGDRDVPAGPRGSPARTGRCARRLPTCRPRSTGSPARASARPGRARSTNRPSRSRARPVSAAAAQRRRRRRRARARAS